MYSVFRYVSLCIILSLSSCASVSLVDSWQGGAPGGRHYHRLLMVGMLTNRTDRLACEEKTAAVLRRKGIATLTSREFITCEGRPSFQALAEAVEKSGADAVLSIHPIRPEPREWDGGAYPTLESVSVYPGYWLPELFARWDIYSHYRNAVFYDLSENQDGLDFVVQANLFEAETRRLIWAGKLEFTASRSGSMEDDAVAETVMEALLRNGLLSPPPREERLMAEQQPVAPAAPGTKAVLP